jgi:hypothetical protein
MNSLPYGENPYFTSLGYGIPFSRSSRGRRFPFGFPSGFRVGVLAGCRDAFRTGAAVPERGFEAPDAETDIV